MKLNTHKLSINFLNLSTASTVYFRFVLLDEEIVTILENYYCICAVVNYTHKRTMLSSFDIVVSVNY